MGSIGFSFRNITYRRPEEALFASDAVCMDSPEVLQPFFLCEPPEQVRLFITLFCVSVAFSLIINHPAAISYYRFVANANLPQSGRRGLGYNACKAYGIFPIGHLPESHFQMVGWLLVVSLLLACHSHLAPRFFLFASFGLYFLYFGQLFCESKHGGHGALLLPSVLLLLALSGGPLGSPWSLVFIKLFLGVIYFAGAVSKVVVAGVFGRPWLGSTMQAYIVDAMWSRPHSSSLVRALQCFIIQRWYLCTFLALSGLIFEFAWLPVVMFGGRLGSVLAGAVAFSFHLGVDLLQGLDFKPFWCPVFWVFLPDVQAIWHGQDVLPNEIWTILAQGFEEEPCRWIMSAAYLLLQVVVAIRFMDCWEGMECLPLTCCPMFAVPRNLFDDELRAGVMTDLDLRGGGHVDFAYNFFPWSTELPLSTTDLQHMPGRHSFKKSQDACSYGLQATKGNPDLMNWMKFFTPTEWHPYGIFNVDSGELRIGQALRCVRLIRILKSVRTISAFRILWSLETASDRAGSTHSPGPSAAKVSGIVDSGRILLWTLTIILVVLYMFSIFFVQLLVKSGLNLTPDQTDMVDGFMKTVPEAMFTLFQCLTLDSWTWFSRELQKDQPFVGVLWLLYVAVACMVLNNLVIAVIVNNAIARAEEDEELQASIARETTEGELNDLRQLFDELVPEADRDYMTQEDIRTAFAKDWPQSFRAASCRSTRMQLRNRTRLCALPGAATTLHQ
eukprot:g23777.t1